MFWQIKWKYYSIIVRFRYKKKIIFIYTCMLKNTWNKRIIKLIKLSAAIYVCVCVPVCLCVCVELLLIFSACMRLEREKL